MGLARADHPDSLPPEALPGVEIVHVPDLDAVAVIRGRISRRLAREARLGGGEQRGENGFAPDERVEAAIPDGVQERGVGV